MQSEQKNNNLLLGNELLATLPKSLREELLTSYAKILKNFIERRWEPAELNGGKLCEIIYSILDGYIKGQFPRKSSKPRNMVEACRLLEQASAIFPRSIKVQIPRMLIALYEIRNNRGVGHVGGDVDPNHMDAVCVLEISKWLMSELVRIFHNVSTEIATQAVENLIEKTSPMVWKVGENLRVLSPSMNAKDKMLVLLYHSQGAVSEAELFRWVEHSNSSIFRRDILRRSHKAKLIEYDSTKKTVEISPLGIKYVESLLLSPAYV